MRVNWGVKSVRMERKGQETLPSRWGRKRPWSCPGWGETMEDPPESLELSWQGQEMKRAPGKLGGQILPNWDCWRQSGSGSVQRVTWRKTLAAETWMLWRVRGMAGKPGGYKCHGYLAGKTKDQVSSTLLLTSTRPYILETGPRKIFFYSIYKMLVKVLYCHISF